MDRRALGEPMKSIVVGCVLFVASALSGPASAQDKAIVPGSKEFILYFDAGQSSVGNADQNGVLNAAVAYAKSNGMHKVTLTGHTDTAEANPQALSLARANAVLAGLKSHGLPASVKIVSVTGAGASDLAFPTAPKTAEPLNRRTAVDLEP